MKLLNIFKKRIKDSTKSSVQSLDKKQLEKVIGGIDLTDTTQDPKKIDLNTVKERP